MCNKHYINVGGTVVVFCFLCFFWPRGLWDLVPQPGIEPGPSAVRTQSRNHWTSREVPIHVSLYHLYLLISSSHCHKRVRKAPSFTLHMTTCRAGRKLWEGDGAGDENDRCLLVHPSPLAGTKVFPRHPHPFSLEPGGQDWAR